jgi:threonine/homoserine/homoserine lactone efflux protein
MHSLELWLFFCLVFAVILLPGLDMGFVLASALVGGRRAGLAAMAGIVLGGFVHVVAVLSGAALFLQASPRAFQALLVGGSAYLAWVGWSIFHSTVALSPTAGLVKAPLVTLRKGLVTCLLNPKAYLFMLAVFPRFLHPAAGSLWAQGAVLSAIIAATQVLVYGAVALAADRVRRWSGPRAGAVLPRTVGAVLMLAAVATLGSAWW